MLAGPFVACRFSTFPELHRARWGCSGLITIALVFWRDLRPLMSSRSTTWLACSSPGWVACAAGELAAGHNSRAGINTSNRGDSTAPAWTTRVWVDVLDTDAFPPASAGNHHILRTRAGQAPPGRAGSPGRSGAVAGPGEIS